MHGKRNRRASHILLPETLPAEARVSHLAAPHGDHAAQHKHYHPDETENMPDLRFKEKCDNPFPTNNPVAQVREDPFLLLYGANF